MHSAFLLLSLVLLTVLNLCTVLPASVLSLSTWKLNGFTGDDLSDPEYYEYSTSELQTYNDDRWFYDDDEAVYFKCYVGYPTTETPGNPRVELRQVQDSDSEDVYWDGTTSTVHTMEAQIRVDRLPSSGVLCMMQIHGTDDFDDVIRVQFSGDADQTSGSVRMKISGYVTEDLLGSSQFLDTDFSLEEYHEFVLQMTDSVVTLSANGTTIFTSETTSSTENYFKAGNYLQSVQGESFSEDDYGLVRIKSLSVSPEY